MKKERIITALGLLVIFVPMLGIPSMYKTITFAAIGLSIVFLSIERRVKQVEEPPQETEPFAGEDNIQAP